jgi:Protein of unknown function (DUF732)
MTTSVFTEVSAAVATTQGRSPSPLRSLLTGFVLASAVLGIAAVATPAAQADLAVDSGGFLGALTSRGITFKSQQAAIAAGHEVCDELGQGKQTSDVANNVMTLSNLDGYHAGFFIGASIAAFCPAHGS